MMKGTISQWMDEKGVGFIQPDDDSKKLFFHISSIKTNARRPQIGDSVFYELMQDPQQRLQAKDVAIEGVAKDPFSIRRKRLICLNQVKTTAKIIVGYISMLVISVSLTALGFEFYHTNTIEMLWPCVVLTAIAFLILSRPKIPKDK